MLAVLASGCTNGSVNVAAICDATVHLRDKHTDALLIDGGNQSIETGADLLAALDHGCAPLEKGW